MKHINRRDFMATGLSGLAGTAVLALSPDASAQNSEKTKLNVLMIAVDDLRPALGCCGDTIARTPNIDRIAGTGTVFTRAYCQQALCSPSRTSLLTGLRPDTTKIYDLETHFRKTIPEAVTLPQQFKASGYHAQAFNKIYHSGLDDPPSWSVPHWAPKAGSGFHSPEGQALVKRLRDEAVAAGRDLKLRANQPRGLPAEAPDAPDAETADGMTAEQAIKGINEAKGKPFFVAVGFLKPHLPFVAPKKYWDMYNPKDLPLARNAFPPKDAPSCALMDWGELRHYYGMPKKGPLAEEQARNLIHGYYACVSFMDAQVGRVVGEIERLGLLDKTVIVIWGDNGYQLGEHGMWCKHTNFETSVRCPLIVRAPGQKASGAGCDALVEFVDVFPSLCDICGVPMAAGLEGASFKPLLDDPKRPWKKAAFSQYPRGKGMGYSMRTDRYRFTEWNIPGKDACERELYDHASDPDENVNIANRPENADLVKQLSAQLRQGWKSAVP